MRTSHATSELCPPPAASADLARRRLLTAVAAAPVIAVSPAFAEGRSNEDDAPLFEMLRHVEALRAKSKQLWEEENKLSGGVPANVWSPEELARHRITDFGGVRGRIVSLSDIEGANFHDSPFTFERTITQSDDGVVIRQVYTTTRQPCDAAEVAAWRERCAARRALYDEKQKAYNANMAGFDMGKYEKILEKISQEHSEYIEKINAYQATTIQGVLKKMRLFYKEYSNLFSEPPENIDEGARIFVAALADFERVAAAG